MLRILINSSLYFILVELHADVVVNMEDIASSSSSCVYMVTLYANNIKMTMMEDEIRSKKEQARKSIISSSRRRTCINALVLPKQRKGRKKCSTIFIYYVCINPSPRLLSLSSDKNRIMRANAHSTEHTEKKRVSPALIVLN